MPRRVRDAARAACKFTVSELAVLRIVGDEVRQRGHCDRCVDEIAARAGVCRSMVKNAIREAARLGLLTVQERRREGRRDLPNVIRIVEAVDELVGQEGPIQPSGSRAADRGQKNYPPRIEEIKRSRSTRQTRSLLPKGSRRIWQRNIASVDLPRARDDLDAYPTFAHVLQERVIFIGRCASPD